jgi:hypothetical protein
MIVAILRKSITVLIFFSIPLFNSLVFSQEITSTAGGFTSNVNGSISWTLGVSTPKNPTG